MTRSEAPWATPQRTHALSPLVGLWTTGRGFIGLALFALAVGRLWLIGVVAVATVVSSGAGWLRQSWSFDGETITLDDGVLQRTFRRVPVGRVQQVEVSEPLLHRLFGLGVVHIETAGASGRAELRLDALGRDDARSVQAAVLAARARERAEHAVGAGADEGEPADRPPPPPAPPETVVLQLSTARVMLSGITSSTLLVVLVVMGAAFDSVSQLPRGLADSIEDQATETATSLGVVSGLLVAAVLTLVAASVAAVAAHHGLTVVRSGDELRLRRGLFERRDAVVPLARVQAVTIRQNPAQRLLGLSSVRVRSAGTGVGRDDRLLVPLAGRAEIDALVLAAIGREVPLDGLIPAPAAARGRRIGRRLGVAAVMVVALALAPDTSVWAVVGAATLLAAVATGLGLDAFSNLGHRRDADVLVTRWGSLLRRTVVAAIPKIQSIRIQASAMQRARGLATLTVDLAGRGIAPTVIDQTADRCAGLDEALRRPRDRVHASVVSSTGGSYATMGVRPTPSHNEES